MSQHMVGRTLFALVMTTLMLAFVFPLAVRPVAASSSQSTTGVIVPLYSYPGGNWTALIQAKEAYPDVPIVAIIDPANGPGQGRDPNYAAGIEQLQSVGIIVIGYDHTSYGYRSMANIEAEMNSYHYWYPSLNGIFFDEMAQVAGYEWYYSALSSYANSLGFSFTVGNPGMSEPYSYIGTVDCIVISEGSGLPSVSEIASSTTGTNKSNFAMLATGVNGLSDSYVASTSSYLGFVFVTDRGANGFDPYSDVPSYLTALVGAVNSADQSVQNGGLQPSGASVLTVRSVGMSGNPIDGLWAVVRLSSDGQLVASGYTPLTFDGPVGQYTVTMSNYRGYAFSHWGNGATSDAITVDLTQSITITASYTD